MTTSPHGSAGRSSDGLRVRPISAATHADLAGRSIWTLATAEDGFGNATISLARIRTGRMKAHAHAPGGEWMFASEGQGTVWVEGLPVALGAGLAAYVPPGMLHNAENPHEPDLAIVGITAPGVEPGSYAEQSPIFEATGRLTSTDRLIARRMQDRTAGSGGTRLVSPAAADFPVSVTHLRMEPGSSVTRRDASSRAWVVVVGAGQLDCDGSTVWLDRYTVVLAPDEVPVSFRAEDRPVELLELRLPS